MALNVAILIWMSSLKKYAIFEKNIISSFQST